jgi:hypothetical protein
MKDSPNPPTARPGIKASMAAEHATTAASPDTPASNEPLIPGIPTAAEAAPPNAPSMLNPNPSPVEQRARVAGTAFSEEMLESWASHTDTLPAAVAGILHEALALYRGSLIGLYSRVQSQGSLNPGSIEDQLRAYDSGIQRAGQLLEVLNAAMDPEFVSTPNAANPSES